MELQAKDLRIGNLVQLDSSKNLHPKRDSYIREVENITEDGINDQTWEYNFGGDRWEDLEPIPLTEEWYNKLDVEQITKLFKILPLKFDMSTGEKVTLRLIGIEGDVLYNYVHEIQNVIGAMSGEELTLKQ